MTGNARYWERRKQRAEARRRRVRSFFKRHYHGRMIDGVLRPSRLFEMLVLGEL